MNYKSSEECTTNYKWAVRDVEQVEFRDSEMYVDLQYTGYTFSFALVLFDIVFSNKRNKVWHNDTSWPKFYTYI